MKRIATILMLMMLGISLPVFGQDDRQQPASKKFQDPGTARTAEPAVIVASPGSILTFLLQEFEGSTFPPAGWTSEGSGSAVWVRSVDASGYGVGTGSAFADFYSIQSGQFSLITPNFPPTVAGDSLKFDHAYATYQTENDRLQISSSTNGGTSWTVLITLDGGVSGPLVTAPPTTSPFVPTSSQWATKGYALPVGSNKVRFTGISAYGNNLYVDNVLVGTPFMNDVGVLSIDAPRTNIVPGTYSPKATVRNYGLATQSFPVTLTISPGGYTSTQNVTNLAPGARQQLTFTDWTPPIGGYSLSVFSQLATEQNSSNDTTSGFHIVSTLNRGVLLEYCTGTWCQWCPCGDNTAETLLSQHPTMVVLAYHGPAGSGSDPYTTYNGNSILNLLGFSAYPTANFDRQNSPGDYTTWTGFCENRYNNYAPTPITISIQSLTYNPATRVVDVTVAMTSNCTLPFQYKVNYVITENNLVYPQTGNSSCPGSSTWVHKWVVRNMVNGATGENVNTGSWTAGQTITRTFSTTLNQAWVAANCGLNVFVYRDNPALGSAEIQNAISTPVVVTGVEERGEGLPERYELSQNYPNPFNPNTSITMAVPKEGFVSLKVFDVTGKEVLTGVNEILQPGYYNVHIDGSNLSSGVYFYTLKAGGFTQTKKMTLMK